MLEEKIDIKDKAFYFCTSMLFSGAKTIGYAFTIPSSIRKIIEKSDSYKNHKVLLTKIAKEAKQENQANKYIDLGDLVGFLGGITGIGLYTSEIFQHPKILVAWIIANSISGGYEITRKFNKSKLK